MLLLANLLINHYNIIYGQEEENISAHIAMVSARSSWLRQRIKRSQHQVLTLCVRVCVYAFLFAYCGFDDLGSTYFK